jgi:tetratricopeptide (TPR) repeat protein
MTYAYSLCLLGANHEALQLLSSVDAKKNPEAYFLTALTYFRQWKYQQSLPLLKNFTASAAVEKYRKIVGQVNLAAALIITGQYEEALHYLEQIQTVCETNNYSLLLGNSFELRAQALIFLKQFDQALISLDRARALLRAEKGLFLLFVEKWALICRAYQNPTPEILESLKQLKQKASRLEDFETVRECDLFEAVFLRDATLLRKVIMGTPSESYRNRARSLFGESLKPLGHFEWVLESDEAVVESGALVFNPYEKQKDGSALYEKPQLLSLFEALTKDFYKPSHLGGLFRVVYPEEKFNPFTSPNRVIRLMKRLDQWFRANDVGLVVEFKKSQFQLKVQNRTVRILIQRGQRLSSDAGRWNEIRNAFRGKAFTTSQVTELLGISKTSAQRWIQQALRAEKIQSIGHGRSASYRILHGEKRKRAA